MPKSRNKPGTTPFLPNPAALLHNPALRVVLMEPQIPANAGNVARLCAACACHLVLAGELGFSLSDSRMKRAGLDYWRWVSWEHAKPAQLLFDTLPPQRFHLLSTHGRQPYTRIPIQWGDWVWFGKETAGLPKAWLERWNAQCYTLPMPGEGVRSINLASAVSAVVYDLLRRLHGW